MPAAVRRGILLIISFITSMFEENATLRRYYAELKRLEKLLELNLSIIEELEEILWDNLEELEEYLPILEYEERIFAEKVRASIKTILKHIGVLKDKTERQWEEVEIGILNLFVNKSAPVDGNLTDRYFGEFYERLETLKDYILFHSDLFREELERYNLFGKFPADVYIRFLEKLTEFNRDFWR
jgi:hypothetical protein